MMLYTPQGWDDRIIFEDPHKLCVQHFLFPMTDDPVVDHEVGYPISPLPRRMIKDQTCFTISFRAVVRLPTSNPFSASLSAILSRLSSFWIEMNLSQFVCGCSMIGNN